MIKELTWEICKCLKDGYYMAALTSALTIPDMCGKAEFPNLEKNKKRYVDWFDKYIGNHEKERHGGKGMPYLSGELVYSLRCSLLHEDNPNIQVEKIENEDNKITKFKILVEEKNKFGIYASGSGITWREDKNNNFIICDRTYELHIQQFCYFVLGFCEDYFLENKENFKFDYTILDLKEEIKAINMWPNLKEEGGKVE